MSGMRIAQQRPASPLFPRDAQSHAGGGDNKSFLHLSTEKTHYLGQ